MTAIEDEVITALSFHFNVSVIDQDFDYAALCDQINPDCVIVESPNLNRSIPLSVKNIGARPDIPRIGYSINDPHDTSRVDFMRMLDQWKIDRYFTTCAAALIQSPEMGERGFALPLYINPAIFKDYGLEKTIPLSIFGGMLCAEFYNWRAETAATIQHFIPTLVYTHPGYEATTAACRFPLAGESYAKMINRSYFSLADTTRLGYAVRKHLEIPASGAVLIAPETPELTDLGFVDMQNCILGSGQALLDKIEQASGNPDLYNALRCKGHALVHGRYTAEKWTGILDWYRCEKARRPGESVQQKGLFGPFVAVPQEEAVPALKGDLADNQYTLRMKRAREAILLNGDLASAHKDAHEILTWLGHITEPWVLLGLIALLRGAPEQGCQMFLVPQSVRKKRDNVDCLDPEEIAWISFSASLIGNKALLDEVRSAALSVRHISLRRMQWLGTILAKDGDASNPPADVVARAPDDTPSIHWMGEISLSEWLGLVDRILSINGMQGIQKGL